MLPVVEMFGPTIQGEGKRMGAVSAFIRFGGCNFSCAGFKVPYEVNGETRYGCDSYFAVDKSFKDTWKFMDYREIVDALDCHINTPNHYHKTDLVITGGEPLLHWNNQDFQSLLQYYISRGHKVTIETNASIDIKFDKDYQKEISFSMSVKLSNSGESERKRLKIDVIDNILVNSKGSYLKFVVSHSNDILEIEELLKALPYYADVYLMPLGETKEQLSKSREIVVDTCIEKGFMYSDRLHIVVWDNKQGV